MNRWHLAGTNAIRLVVGIAVVVGWVGVYYAFQGHWLGILLALLATGFTFGAVRVGDIRARAQNAALRDALASAAARNRELERLRRVAATLLASSELGVLLQEIADAAADLLQAESSAVALVGEEGRFLRVAAVTGPLAPTMGALIPVDGSLVGTVVSSGTPIVTNDMNADPRSYRMPGLDVLLRTAAMVPLRSAGVVIGTVSVYNHRDGRPFTEHDLQLLETLGDQVVVGLDRAAVLDDVRRSERSLAAKNVELQRAARLKGEFLANMSHELRTPLNAIIGFSDLMLTEGVGPVSAQQREFLEAVLRNGRHLLELINGILDLSKVEAGRMELEYSSFDLRALLDGGAAMLRERAAAHGIELGIEVADDVGQVYSDELRLKQVLLNLMTNAVKFTGDGGSVLVRAAREGAEIVITVTDTGIGVPEADRERIFESFQQGGRGSSREEGTGLGLTLSRRIVGLLGGRMWLDTEVGRGSTFGFSLPAHDAAAPAAQGDPSRSGAMVVVIEDDRPSLDLFSAYLTNATLQVTTARDGPSGLDAVRRTRPDAVLLDIRLPGIDGWAVLRELKSDPATRDIPVIVVSIVDERSRGVALGAAAYLVKPVGREELMTALAGVGVSVPLAEPGSAVER
jgi:signal transduction histidine kinase/CheY-like chemotaxis protein